MSKAKQLFVKRAAADFSGPASPVRLIELLA
jgi:hypothetical protein